eukprot:TRINITY_DN57218_c0_g1_i1.p1 TRINITY_DN57218_c0_g1~~TRINITY_DN57218_c0_g1_i1.p1  ORF type:complete len:1389 (-),score=293.85 TRINITY_DN57218_c0_g1_i1:199-4365(-)
MSVLSFSAESALTGLGALRVALPPGDPPAPNERWRRASVKLKAMSTLGFDNSKTGDTQKNAIDGADRSAVRLLSPPEQRPQLIGTKLSPKNLGVDALPDINSHSSRRRSWAAPQTGPILGDFMEPPSPTSAAKPARSPRTQVMGLALPQVQHAATSLVHIHSSRRRWSSVASHLVALNAMRNRRMSMDATIGQAHFLLPSAPAQERPVNRYLRIGEVGADSNIQGPGALGDGIGSENVFRMTGFKCKGWNAIKGALDRRRVAGDLSMTSAEASQNSADIATFTRQISPKDTKSNMEIIEAIEKIQREGLGCAGQENEQYAKDLPPGIEKLAACLVNRFGSLERAFGNFDYNHQGKVTRGQWETTLSTIRLDMTEVAGLHAKKVFRAIDTLDGGASKLEFTSDQWIRFFKKHLEGTPSAHLVEEDRGCQAPKRWAQMKKLPLKALAFLAASDEPVSSTSGASLQHQHSNSICSAEDSDVASPEDRAKGRMKVGSKSWKKARASLALAHLRGDGSMDGSEGSLKLSKSMIATRNEHDWEKLLAEAEQTDHSEEDEHGLSDCESSSSSSSSGGSSSSNSSISSDDDNAGYIKVPKRHRKLSDVSKGSRRPSLDEEAESARRLGVPSGSGVDGEKGKDVDQTKVDHAKLMKIINGTATDAELAEMTAAELQALAEQQQLEEEVRQLDLKHIEAFAYVLIAKLKTLSRAFRYFDYMRKKKISNVVWGTGIALLHIDTEKLTGWKPGHIFYRIDQDPSEGLITKRKWREFFKDVKLPDEAQEKLKEGPLKKRAKATYQKFHRRASLFRGDKGKRKVIAKGRMSLNLAEDGLERRRRKSKDGEENDDDELDEDEEELQRMKEEETEDFRKKVIQRLQAIEEGDSLTWTEAMLRGPAESLLNPWMRAQIVRSVAEMFGLWTLMGAEVASAEEPAHGLGRSCSMAVKAAAPEPGAILICNLKAFVEETEQRLDSMEDGGSVEFSHRLTDLQRSVVHVLAANRGLTTISEGKGIDRHVVAYAATQFTRELRALFASIQPGGKVHLSKELTPVQRRLVHLIAAEMECTVKASKDEHGQLILEVANMSHFTSAITDDLSQLDVGQEKVFELTAGATEEEKQIIHDIAGKMGLTSKELQEKGRQSIVVTNQLDKSLEEAEAKMKAIEEIGSSSGSFCLPANERQRKVFWNMADDMGFDATLPAGRERNTMAAYEKVRLTKVRESKEHVPSLCGPDGYLPFASSGASAAVGEQQGQGSCTAQTGGNQTAGAEMGGGSGGELLGSGAQPEEAATSQEALVSKAFALYATGNHRGTKTFLRFLDLREFSEDLRGVLPKKHKLFSKFSMLLEMCFDDTLQLQVDLGIRVGSGLTLQFFQVFVQKAMGRLGLQIASVLLAILDSEV